MGCPARPGIITMADSAYPPALLEIPTRPACLRTRHPALSQARTGHGRQSQRDAARRPDGRELCQNPGRPRLRHHQRSRPRHRRRCPPRSSRSRRRNDRRHRHRCRPPVSGPQPGPGPGHCRTRRHRFRIPARHASHRLELSAAQPHHLRPVAWRAGRRGGPRKRFADYRTAGRRQGREVSPFRLDYSVVARGCHK